MRNTQNYKFNLPEETDFVEINDFNENFDKIDSELSSIKESLNQKASASHNQASSTITSMSGYSKGSNSGSVASTDSLNTAIGKLETQISSKASASHNHSSSIITSMGGYTRGTNTSSITTSDSLNTAIGKLEYQLNQKASASHNQASNTITSMSGYSKASSTSGISSSDSLNYAIGKLEYQLGQKASASHNHSSSTITSMSGYTKSSSTSSISSGDSLNTAIGKLEYQLGQKIETSTTPIRVGAETEATTDCIALGYRCRVNQRCSSAVGYNSLVHGTHSHVFGSSNTGVEDYSNALGYNLITNYQYETVVGAYNKSTPSATGARGDIFTVGNGTSSTNRSNAFRVTHQGIVYSRGSYNSSGADFAEYFEWKDANLKNEDRIGYFVTLDEDKIRLANASDDYILGIISGTACLIGNSYDDDWSGRYLYDKWGRVQSEDVTIPATYDTKLNENGEEEQIVVEKEHIVNTMKINPDYNNNTIYIPRSKRKEWAVVGMIGQIFLRDDGSCEVGGYCKCKDGAIATNAKAGEANCYKVMKRIDESTIQVLFR